MEVGNVNSMHLVLALKVKSVLDPCEDVNDNEDAVSLGAESLQRTGTMILIVRVTQIMDFILLLLLGNSRLVMRPWLMKDPAEDEQQFGRVKDWISLYHLKQVELTEILSNFPDISVKSWGSLSREVLCPDLEKMFTQSTITRSNTCMSLML
ncbi:hypothetical protein LIER_41540 [Lithospermum erythrorhizon]|uniref:Uncharacterized protein n=1 Tax=Lithospermum erythrorhizon TaxID=34254 RepID=A0AAV3REI5_LITER